MFYKPKKSLGQNFLIDKQVVQFMINALELQNSDTVVEIGAGPGTLTKPLYAALKGKEGKVFAVEMDGRFVGELREVFSETDKVTVVEADILEWLPQQDLKKEFKVLGSLPYYITSPILHMLVKLSKRPKKAILMVQKEVGEKIAAKAAQASYLSIFLQTFYDVVCLKTVSSKSFQPVPKVDGVVVRLERKKVEEIFKDPKIIDKYEGFLHKGFQTPRKMLNKPFTKEELVFVGVDGTKRPQALDVSTWKKMFLTLCVEA